MQLSRYPRVPLAHLPTPLEPLPRLTAALGGPDLWIKRDDCTGLATGGNKTRKLEFALGEALESGADTVVTWGAVQSNHVRQTVAAARRLGLDCDILLERRIDEASEDYRRSGNVLLDRLFGARLLEFDDGTDFAAAMEQVADDIRQRGGKPYLIPSGASNPVGALGYVNAAFELMQQANDRGLTIDHVVLATGSAGTQAGLLAGFRTINADVPVLGIGVHHPRDVQEERVRSLAAATLDYLGVPADLAAGDVVANCDYIGPGYGLPTAEMQAAIRTLARLEGILADPVYSGKALAGLIDLVGNGYFADARNVVFLHTGGAPALFAYRTELGLD